MKKSFLLAIAASFLVAAFAANATPGGESGNTNCNGQGNPNSPCTGSGGQGGAGGAGGTGVGVGVGIANAAAAAQANANSASVSGAAVVGSGNSSVRNTNANVQGQQQGQTQSSRNDNRSNATGGASSATSASGGNTLSGGAVTVSVEGAKGDVYVAPAQARDPVATAYAAPLTSSNGTCMGSSSGGAQGAAFGISLGTTWTDSSCDIRYDAEALRAAGLPMAARARLCQKPEIAKAMAAAGTPCEDKTAAKRADASPAVTTASIALLP